MAIARDIGQQLTGEPGRNAVMGSQPIRRWESGALAHAVTDPFGLGPVPWLRGSETYFDDTGHVVPWYVDPLDPTPAGHPPGTGTGTAKIPAPRTASSSTG